MAGPLKQARMLVDLACAQDDVEEQDAEEKLGDTTLQDQSLAEENDEDLEWHHQRPSDKGYCAPVCGRRKLAEQNICSQYY
jgi:hypothetical protein